jgi:O-succinylbenzoic acid--CoA ligase
VNELVALDLPGGQRFVDEIRRIWDAGDAFFPVDQRLPSAAKEDLFVRFGVASVIAADGAATPVVSRGEPIESGDAIVVATSGSSGEPKGVVLTHTAIDAAARATSQRLGVQPDDQWLACLPLSHVGGLSVITRAMRSDTTLTVHASFDPDRVNQSDATLVSLVPTALGRIESGRFRKILLGGSRPPVDRPENCVTTYGMTETGGGVVYDRRALEGVEIRIAQGEVQLRCAMLLRSYRNGIDPKSSDGWYPTGDLGEIDAGGLLSILGRRDDLIVTGGENVWPEPIEAILRVLPDVVDVVVYGVNDDEWGQRVAVDVVPLDATKPIGLEQLQGQIRERLPAFHVPRQIRYIEQVPRTSIGKVKRLESRER